MTIKLYKKQVYGQECFEILDGDFKRIYKQLTGYKTFQKKHVDALTDLLENFEVKVVNN